MAEAFSAWRLVDGTNLMELTVTGMIFEYAAQALILLTSYRV